MVPCTPELLISASRMYMETWQWVSLAISLCCLTILNELHLNDRFVAGKDTSAYGSMGWWWRYGQVSSTTRSRRRPKWGEWGINQFVTCVNPPDFQADILCEARSYPIPLSLLHLYYGECFASSWMGRDSVLFPLLWWCYALSSGHQGIPMFIIQQDGRSSGILNPECLSGLVPINKTEVSQYSSEYLAAGSAMEHYNTCCHWWVCLAKGRGFVQQIVGKESGSNVAMQVQAQIWCTTVGKEKLNCYSTVTGKPKRSYLFPHCGNI